MNPYSPCAWPFGPARKYRLFVGPAWAPLPNAIAQSPSIAIGAPLAVLTWPLYARPPAVLRLVGADPPVAEVADEEVVAVGAEVRGRHRESPRRVERRVLPALRCDARHEHAVRAEPVDVPEPAARDRVGLLLVLLG